MKKNRHSYAFTAATAVVLALSSVSVPTVSKANFTFSDVPSTSVFYGPIVDLLNRGIISGFPDGTFRPNALLTRGQAAKLIARTLNFMPSASAPSFPDVSPSHEYAIFIQALHERGIISGFPDGTFKMHEPITRNQMAKMIAQAFELSADASVTMPFSDIAPSYHDVIHALYSNDVTVGRTPTTFSGETNVTRAQMAAFLIRAETALKESQHEAYNVTFFAEEFNEEEVTIRGKTYRVSEAVQPIFAEQNTIALQNAELTVTVEDGEIKRVERLALNHPGTKNDIVTFAAEAEVDYLNVNANYVVVRDLVVLRGAVASSSVDEEIYFEDANIRGILTVGETDVISSLRALLPAGSPKIVMSRTAVDGVTIEAQAASITSDETVPRMTLGKMVGAIDMAADVGAMHIQSTRNVALTGEGDIEAMTLNYGVQLSLDVDGTVEQLTISSSNAKLKLGANVDVESYHLPDGFTLEQLLISTPAPAIPALVNSGQSSYTIFEQDAFTLPTVTTSNGQVIAPDTPVDTSRVGEQQIVYRAAGYTPLTITVIVKPKATFNWTSPTTFTLYEGEAFTIPTVTTADGQAITPTGTVDATKAGTYTLTYVTQGYNALVMTVNVLPLASFKGDLTTSLTVSANGEVALPLITDNANDAVVPVLTDELGNIIASIPTNLPGQYRATYVQRGYYTHVVTITVLPYALFNVRYVALNGTAIQLNALRVYQKQADGTEVDVTNKNALAKGVYYFELLAPTYRYDVGSFEVKGNTLVIIHAVAN